MWSLGGEAGAAVDELGEVVGVAGEGAPADDDRAVVARADPSALGVVAPCMDDEVHGPLEADVVVGGDVPARKGLGAPEAQLAAPVVVADVLGLGELERADLDLRAGLLERHRLGGDRLRAVDVGLPRRPPRARESWPGDVLAG